MVKDAYSAALRNKIESLRDENPEKVLKYLSNEYRDLKGHGNHTADSRKALQEVRDEYVKSLNGKIDPKEIRKLIRKYPIDNHD